MWELRMHEFKQSGGFTCGMFAVTQSGCCPAVLAVFQIPHSGCREATLSTHHFQHMQVAVPFIAARVW